MPQLARRPAEQHSAASVRYALRKVVPTPPTQIVFLNLSAPSDQELAMETGMDAPARQYLTFRRHLGRQVV